jgi:predicted permease
MPKLPASGPVAIGLRLYRALARAFPYEFLTVYGEELDQITEDAIEPIWRRHGILGLARLLADLAIRIPAEYLAEFRKDVRYGCRMLAASPGFTAVALLSLSLGIAVAASAFSEMNAAVLRDLPGVPDPGRLVAMQAPASYPAFERFRQRTDLFASAFAYLAPVPFGVTLNGHTERTAGHIVSPGYFSTLGIHPVLGRFPDGDAAAASVVVSYRFWQRRLASDPSIVGKALDINGRPFTIVAVGPKDFLGAGPMVFFADLWLSTRIDPQVAPELAGDVLSRRDRKVFNVVGRLNPGVTTAHAEAELDTVARQFEQAFGEEDKNQKGFRMTLLNGGKMFPVRSQDLPMVTVLPIVLVSLVLLIACSNVANMMLARSAGRRKEVAIRLALGAGRARLIRQLLTESMLIAIGAGVLGFLLTIWFMRMASQVRMPFPMPVAYDAMPDARVLIFSFVLTLLTGMAFGLVPALQGTRPDLAAAIKEGGSVQLRRHRRLSLRNLLVLSQVAGSLSLLLVTSLLVIGFRRSVGIDVGFDPQHIFVISLDPVRDGYSGARAAVFFEKLLDRVQRLPGVAAASFTDKAPMTISGQGTLTFSSAGDGKVTGTAAQCVVGKDYFDVLGIPILSGRGFRKEDEANQSTSVIVSEAVVRHLWNGEYAIGRRIDAGDNPANTKPNKLAGMGSFDHRVRVAGKGLEVVGVVKDVRSDIGLEKPGPAIYFPLHAADYAQPSLNGVTLMVRATPGSGDVLGAVRREIAAMDGRITPFNARGMTEQVDNVVGIMHIAVWIYGAIGFFGLILASVGLAGVTAYSVTQRSREIGIRVALGATRADVLALVMKEGMVLVCLGSAIGLVMASGATRVLSAFFSAISRTVGNGFADPVLLIGAPLLLALLALVACYVPARRSTGIDPVAALRQE